MSNQLGFTLHALAEETSDGQSAGVDISTLRSAAKFDLRVTALTGAFTAFVQTSPDNSTGWRTVAPMPRVVGVSRVRLNLDDLERYVRLSWTVATSCTFVATGRAFQLFAQRDDIADDTPPNVWAELPSDVIAASLIAASSETESYLASGHDTPITAWPDSITRATAKLAVYHLIKRRGFDPDGADKAFIMERKEARDWLMKFGEKDLTSPVTQPENRRDIILTSGDENNRNTFKPQFSDDWGDFS